MRISRTAIDPEYRIHTSSPTRFPYPRVPTHPKKDINTPRTHKKLIQFPDTMVPLDTRALQRFYEPIILTKALTNIYRETGLSHPPDPVTYQETEEERLKSFINRLANVCDNTKGGTTVSAAAVLQDEEGIVYLLASNQVSVSDMMRASELVTRILERIAGVSGLDEVTRRGVKVDVLRMVLVHHWKRVRLYMRALATNAAHCLAGLRPGSHPDVRGS